MGQWVVEERVNGREVMMVSLDEALSAYNKDWVVTKSISPSLLRVRQLMVESRVELAVRERVMGLMVRREMEKSVRLTDA